MTSKRGIRFFAIFFIFIISTGVFAMRELKLIPKPREYKMTGGEVSLSKDWKIYLPANTEEERIAANSLAEEALNCFGWEFAIAASERVVPLALACATVSASATRQSTRPPKRARRAAEMPLAAMLTSTRMFFPARMAARPAATAWGWKRRFSAKLKSPVAWMVRRTTANSSGEKRVGPSSRSMTVSRTGPWMRWIG